MSEARLIELETRLAYQDDTLRVLDDVLRRQQDSLDRLAAVVQQLQERVAGLRAVDEGGPAQPDPRDEVPPHY